MAGLAVDLLPTKHDRAVSLDRQELYDGVAIGLDHRGGKSIDPVGEANNIIRVEAAHTPQLNTLELAVVSPGEGIPGPVTVPMND